MKNHRAERRDRVRAKLHEAMGDQVCLTLDMAGATVTGFCVGVGRQWGFLHVAMPWPDGYVAVRLADLERIRHGRSQALEKLAFERAQAWPPPPVEGLDLDRTEDLLTGLAERYPLLGVEVRGASDQMFVGAPVLVADGTLMLQELTSEPAWEALSTWRLRDLTRITVGDRFFELLADVAPERPEEPSPFAD